MRWYLSAELHPKGHGLRAAYEDAYWHQLRFCRSFENSAVLNQALS
jgi:hypothetical protein